MRLFVLRKKLLQFFQTKKIFENVASHRREPSFVQEITKHLLLLKDENKRYFFIDGDAQACTYTRNTFTARPDDLPEETGEQEELINLQ